MDISVEALCNLLAKHKLLDAADVRSLRQRWLAEAGADAANAERFGKWLVAGGNLTEFQMGMLGRGAVEQLVFDQYVVEERIGHGRMAGVYRAVHPTGQQVALKVLPPSKAVDAQFLARFQREARLAIPLEHLNIVRTFQQGRTKAGLHYLVMELLEGESLEDVVKRRKALTPVEAVYLGVQTLDGLQYLFEAGLIHRDLKPGNLMIVGGQADTVLRSTVKILDIGLGRALFDDLSDAAPERADLTTEGSILGTPAYMAPEQARNARSADIRSDIYGVGCLLYEALAGKPPFDDPNYMNQILRHATEAPRPLPQINKEMPEALWQVLEIMLSKDPAQRFSTPRQASKALRASIPAPAEAPGTADPSAKMCSYLTWLAAQGIAPQPAAASAPVRGLQDAATVSPLDMPTPMPPPLVHRTQPPSLPVARLALPDASPPAPMASPVPSSPPPLLQIKGVAITHRDLICAGIGAGVLLVLAGFLWLLTRLFGG
jgi:serine/threonine protein kinase